MALEGLTRKVGPLPMWGWGAVLLGAALVYSLLLKPRSKGDAGDAGGTGPIAEVPSDQVPDFISQTNVTVNGGEPAAPAGPTPTGPTTPPAARKAILPAVTKVPPKVTGRRPVKGGAKAVSYTVQHGDTLSSIAKRYGLTWQALWAYNTTAGVRPAATIKTLQSRGPNLLYAGETILIPPKK